ncbi:MAG: cytochrome c oxidase subunit 3 family protein [Gemmataceae bacterium]|nr:cytochrome c oxidase subunit 3 family protein [Gemmataceae bacterium]
MSSESHGLVAHHFENLEQQRDANTLGMWLFLASEILFFGVLFTAYTTMRYRDPGAFALASSKLDAVLGGVNTAILLTSSFTMALAVWAAQMKRQDLLRLFLGLTIIFGGVFLAIKGYEWMAEAHHGLVPGAGFGHGHDGEVVKDKDGKTPLTEGRLAGLQMAMVFYFVITGLHALHMVVGIVLLGMHWWWAWRYPDFGVKDHTPIELGGLYWHFVDVVWIFVFPVLYLLRS